MPLVRCGLSPCAAQILCTDDSAMPVRAAMVRSLQRVAARRLLVERQIDDLLDFPRRQRLAPRRACGVLQQGIHPLAAERRRQRQMVSTLLPTVVATSTSILILRHTLRLAGRYRETVSGQNPQLPSFFRGPNATGEAKFITSPESAA